MWVGLILLVAAAFGLFLLLRSRQSARRSAWPAPREVRSEAASWESQDRDTLLRQARQQKFGGSTVFDSLQPSTGEGLDSPYARHRVLWSASRSPEMFRLEYVDSDGVVTDRTIVLEVIEEYGGRPYLNGHCLLRDERRSFRVDRISRAWHADTDERIGDAPAYFTHDLPEAKRTNPAHDSVMARVRSSLGVLVWIAMADRDLTEAENEVLLAFIGARSDIGGKKLAGQSWSAKRAAFEISRMRVRLADATAATARMAPRGREAALVREYAARLVVLGGEGAQRRAEKALSPLGFSPAGTSPG